MHILALETSCDETSAAVIESSGHVFSLKSSIVSSQINLHAKWGGVVPNLAAREHLNNITPVIEKSFSKAKISKNDVGLIAVTSGPGLIPALLIGVEAAKTLSYLWKVPLMGLHHIEGHIYANFIPRKRDEIGELQPLDIAFPALSLVVSGGHTQLVLMKKHLQYEIIGETLDDAAGEAFDKTARILGLGYPGGPAISASADKFDPANSKYRTSSGSKNQSLKSGDENTIRLPRPMIGSDDFNFSFSGLKTAVLYLTKKNDKMMQKENFISAVAAEFQQSVCDVLIAKTVAAAKKYNVKTIMLAGGVSANRELRRQLGEAINHDLPKVLYRVPDPEFTGDNAAMIGAAAHFRYIKKGHAGALKDNWKKLEANANLKL